MGNCLWTGFGCSQEHAGVLKVITGRGGMCMVPAQNDDDINCRAISGHRHQQEGLSKVDVTHGLDLQLENVAPCRLSSGTAADLLSKISYSERAPTLEVLPSHQKGVWKVKLVITAEQLADILSHQSNTEALIERMSLTAAHAKCTTNYINTEAAQRSSFSSPSSSSLESCQIGCLSGSWKPSLDTISETPSVISNSLGEKPSERSQISVVKTGEVSVI